MKAYDRFGNRHYCQDGGALVVNGRWSCRCPGGPYRTDVPQAQDRSIAEHNAALAECHEWRRPFPNYGF